MHDGGALIEGLEGIGALWGALGANLDHPEACLYPATVAGHKPVQQPTLAGNGANVPETRISRSYALCGQWRESQGNRCGGMPKGA
jgi:hypothetical protein